MSERRLRYSERKQLAETGSLGDLGTTPSVPLRRAVMHLLERMGSRIPYRKRDTFYAHAKDMCEEHFGWNSTVSIHNYPEIVHDVADFLDYVEILVEARSAPVRYLSQQSYVLGQAWPNAQLDFNALFDRHRFAFRLQGGQAHQIGSPALDDIVVGPALLAVRRPGWDEVERSYREALMHQRGGPDENDDAP
jgi:hypothetical protein